MKKKEKKINKEQKYKPILQKMREYTLKQQIYNHYILNYA